MAIEVFNRYENKYLLDGEAYARVIDIMDTRMELDFYNENRGAYTIDNIYYDTDDDFLIRTSLSKPKYKEKLRLRAYGVPEESTKVYLEIKKKLDGMVNKRRTALRLNEAYEFVRTGIPPDIKEYMNGQVVKEITYFLSIYSLKPKVYIAYDRIAYFEKGNPDLRISFDTNIRTRRYDVHLEYGDYGERLLGDDIYLMEVKTPRAEPLWLVHMLTGLDIKRSNFSKYGTEFRNFINSNTEVQYESIV